jgi:Kdo2-lipid IVA lauroyltransferase/acyltransferase
VSSQEAFPGPSLRHRLEYGAYRLGRWLWTTMPEALAVRLGALAGWIAGSVVRIRRPEVDEHLALAFPEATRAWRRRVARASYAHFGREAAILARMPGWSREQMAQRLHFLDLDPVRAAADQERGVVVLTAHLGNWEVAGAGLAALGLPLDVVGKGMANRRFERDLFALRERLGMRVIEMSEAPKGVLRSLGRGRVTALLGDQNAHRHGVFVPFFGKPAATHRGPALFALRTGAPVFVGFAIRDPGWRHTYTVVVHRLDHEVTGDVDEDVRALLEAYHRLLEDAIRSTPEQYFWQHKRWKTRPREEHAASR